MHDMNVLVVDNHDSFTNNIVHILSLHSPNIYLVKNDVDWFVIF